MQPQESQTTLPQSEIEVYEVPAIVYEGAITTRAGSPVPTGSGLFDSPESGTDLFGN